MVNITWKGKADFCVLAQWSCGGTAGDKVIGVPLLGALLLILVISLFIF